VRLLPTVGVVTETPPTISPKAVSDALAALGVYAEPPTDAQLVATERAEGREALMARLSNALYGCALAHLMTAEVAAEQASVSQGYRGESWRATAADAAGIAILLHYTAMQLAADLRTIEENLPVDLGVMSAAAGAAEALKLLLEVHGAQHGRSPRGHGDHEPFPRLRPAGDRSRADRHAVRRDPRRRLDHLPTLALTGRRLTQLHGQGVQAADEAAGPPFQHLGLSGEGHVRVVGEQAGEGDGAFGACQGGAEADVDAVPEREMAWVFAFVVDELGASEPVRVAVGGGKGHEDKLVCGDGGAAEIHHFGGKPQGGDVHRAEVAQVFLQGGRHLVGVGA